MDLFEDDQAEAPERISVNTKFAERHAHNKRREEKDRLESKYGKRPVESDDDSSSSTSEDSDAEALTKDAETDFLRTLSKLKAKAPEIYDKGHTFFKDDYTITSKKEKKEKPMYLKDHERMRLETKGDKAFVSDDDEEPEMDPRKSKLAFNQEQRQIRKELMNSLGDDRNNNNDGDDESDDDGDLFRPKMKTDQDLEEEEEDYERWLGEGGVHDDDTEQELQPLRRFWTDEKLNETDRFLRDYLMKRKWKSDVGYSEDTAKRAMKADEGGVGGGGPGPSGPRINLSDDEDHVEEQERFEKRFNFRFEDADSSEIKTYPREVDGSLRRKVTKRQAARERASSRKDDEKNLKAEEIKRLKNLKQQEILDKLQQIKDLTGNDVEGLENIKLDADFNADDHDQQMQQVFNDNYYDHADDQKPQFPDDLGDIEDTYDDDENYNEGEYEEGYDGTEEYGAQGGYGDDDFIMDADYVEADANATATTAASKKKQSKKEKKKSKKKKKMTRKELKELEAMLHEGELKDVEAAQGNVELQQKLDEYYNLDYEDIVGGIPTRFKYREVIANDYGLSAQEIFTADDKELNQWASLKNMVKYRDESEDKFEKKMYRKRKGDIAFKKKIFDNSKAWAVTEKGTASIERHNASTADRITARKDARIAKQKKRKEEKEAREANGEIIEVKETSETPGENHKERRKRERAEKLAGGGTDEDATKVKKKRKKSGRITEEPIKEEVEPQVSTTKETVSTSATTKETEKETAKEKDASAAETSGLTISARRLAAYRSGSSKLDRQIDNERKKAKEDRAGKKRKSKREKEERKAQKKSKKDKGAEK
eukprot:m.153082 g.153082  ORF g.153082 m.153082 type:complete len:826 (+) comp30828_c1_seq1:116-2593(+)